MADPRPLLDSYSLYIDGRWVDPESGRYDDISPATEAVIAQAPDASLADVDAAIAAARRAFDSGPWAVAAPEERARCLNQLGNALMEHADEFFALSQAEWGCIANERLIQVDGPAFMALHAGELAVQLTDEPIDAFGAAGTTLLRHEPLGVVSILTPWNFPHSLNVMKVSRALAAGNTVVLKPSPLTPLAGLALARIIDEHTDIPPGVVNVVTPSSIEASKLLTTDPRIDMVSFTGSSAVGRDVMAAAGRHHEADPARVRRKVGRHLPRRRRGDRRTAGTDPVRRLLAARRAGMHPAKPPASAGHRSMTRSSTGSSSWPAA